MFQKNDQHQQIPLFSSIDALPKKQLDRLKASWADTFYREYFARIDEEVFAVLYSNEPSRPNIALNVLLGLDTLKSGFGWSDAEMIDHFYYDVQVRYALGYRDLSEGHFELRTMYNFRARVTDHMQKTGENLIEKAFEQVTDEQIAAYELKTDKQRMDSTAIESNIRKMSRLQLLVEVVKRTHRMLSGDDREQYADEFAPYQKGSSGQYTYHIKGKEVGKHVQRIGELMHRLVEELSAAYANEDAYRVLRRVFEEHFVTEESNLRAKEGKELSASSLQSADDWEATYRQKQGEDRIGYVANLAETCNPDNPFQLITKVQTEANNIDDAAMLNEALPEIKERMNVDEMHTDGGYNSPKVDVTMREHKVKQIQTAIRGRKPSGEKLGLDDFEWEINDEGQPQTVTCPNGQQVEVTDGRKPLRYRAAFESPDCEGCSFADQCPTRSLKSKPENVLYFSQQELDLALRRKRSADARASKQNLRSAVEATVRAIKHPFGNGKVPVRGKSRVSMVVTGSAAMNNVRQIDRYLARQSKQNKGEKRETKEVKSDQQSSAFSFFVSFLANLQVRLRSVLSFEPVWAC